MENSSFLLWNSQGPTRHQRQERHISFMSSWTNPLVRELRLFEFVLPSTICSLFPLLTRSRNDMEPMTDSRFLSLRCADLYQERPFSDFQLRSRSIRSWIIPSVSVSNKIETFTAPAIWIRLSFFHLNLSIIDRQIDFDTFQKLSIHGADQRSHWRLKVFSSKYGKHANISRIGGGNDWSSCFQTF